MDAPNVTTNFLCDQCQSPRTTKGAIVENGKTICESCQDPSAKLILLEALKTEREGMIAHNQDRERNGYSQAYGDDAFQILAERMRNLL